MTCQILIDNYHLVLSDAARMHNLTNNLYNKPHRLCANPPRKIARTKIKKINYRRSPPIFSSLDQLLPQNFALLQFFPPSTSFCPKLLFQCIPIDPTTNAMAQLDAIR
jgi:hypothetical protein